MAGREARAKRATTAFTRWESSECTFFPGNYFFLTIMPFRGKIPKLAKGLGSMVLAEARELGCGLHPEMDRFGIFKKDAV